MRTCSFIAVLALLGGCAEETDTDRAYGQLVQALGLGSPTGLPNGLGSRTGLGNGLGGGLSAVNPGSPEGGAAGGLGGLGGTRGAGEVPRDSSQPGTGITPGTDRDGPGQPLSPCSDACAVLINCDFVDDRGDCVDGCEENLAESGADGAALIQCVAGASCATVQNCAP